MRVFQSVSACLLFSRGISRYSSIYIVTPGFHPAILRIHSPAFHADESGRMPISDTPNLAAIDSPEKPH